jgi:Skp family chaperone for outer membrane proteins
LTIEELPQVIGREGVENDVTPRWPLSRGSRARKCTLSPDLAKLEETPTCFAFLNRICYPIPRQLATYHRVEMEFDIMKRTLLAILLFALATVAASTQAPKEQSPPTGTTRVAIVNIGYILNTFGGSSFKSLASAEYWQQHKKHRDDVERWEKAIRDRDFSEGSTDQLKAKISAARKHFDDFMRKMQEDSLVRHWKEIQAAINGYATENKIDVVLGYADPTEKTLLDQFPNVERKMQAMDQGSTVPLFASVKTDISQGVVEYLHKRRREKKD